MNQCLGSGMPNIKKVPRKLHPIGQEFKTLADKHTYCILQLGTVSDKVQKEFDDVDRNLIAAVKRLCKPWFFGGRIAIAVSWFGSPMMTSRLLDQRLYYIVQATTDIIQCLQPERGSSVSVSKIDEFGRTIFVFVYRDKKAKALVSSCSTIAPLCTVLLRRPIFTSRTV